MSDEPKKRSRVWIGWTMFALLIYMSGYFVFSKYYDQVGANLIVFRCSTPIAMTYIPLTWLEAKIARKPVVVFLNGDSKDAEVRSILFEP